MEVQTPCPPDLSNSWKMFFDGSKRKQGAGAGVVIISPKGEKLKYVFQVNIDKVLTHEHVTCTLDAGGHAPQLMSKEIQPAARYARQPEDAFIDPEPHA